MVSTTTMVVGGVSAVVVGGFGVSWLMYKTDMDFYKKLRINDWQPTYQNWISYKMGDYMATTVLP